MLDEDSWCVADKSLVMRRTVAAMMMASGMVIETDGMVDELQRSNELTSDEIRYNKFEKK